MRFGDNELEDPGFSGGGDVENIRVIVLFIWIGLKRFFFLPWFVRIEIEVAVKVSSLGDTFTIQLFI